MESPETNVGLSKKIKTNANKFIQGNEWNYVPFPNIAPFNEWYPGFMRGEYVCITGGTSSSKCLAKDTKVMMFDGSYKYVQDVVVGDILMGPDSKPRNVIETASGQEEMYEIQQTYGQNYTVNKSHILHLQDTRRPTTKTRPKFINISVEDYLKKSNKFKHCYKGVKTGIDFAEKNVELDPYLLGLWLGDGNKDSGGITNTDEVIISYLKDWAINNNCYIWNRDITYYITNLSNKSIITSSGECIVFKNREEVINYLDKSDVTIKGVPFKVYRESNTKEALDYHLKTKFQYKTCSEDISLSFYLRKLNLLHNKHIPDLYKFNSKEVRLKLLAGLIDSDGCLSGDSYSITQKNERLADDIVWLARSLGMRATKARHQATCKECKKDFYEVFMIYIKCQDNQTIPVLLDRKKRKKLSSRTNTLLSGIKVVPKGVGDYYGFSLAEPDGLFLLEDFTITHNTQFTKNIFMFTAIEWAIKNNIDYKVIWFGLEESVEEARYSLYSWLLYKASGGSIRYNIEDFECVGKSVNPEHFEILEKVDALFEKFWSYVHFFDMVDNSYGIYIETKRIAVKRGTFYNLKKALTAEEVLAGEKWTDYKPHNPLEYVAVVVDHIGLMEPQKDEKDLAAAMKKCSKNMRFYITKKFNYIGVVVQQQMLEMENLEHIRESQVYASLQGLGDSKVLSRDYKTVLGITNINRYGLKMANTSVGNVPVSELGDYQRVISILKRRFGKTNRRCVTFTDGCVGHFATLPKPKSEDFNLLTQKIKEYEKLREA